MQMGWMLTGDSFGRSWNNAWREAVRDLISQVGNFTSGNDSIDLDFIRFCVQNTLPNVSPKIAARVQEESPPECFEPPTRTIEELRTAIIAEKM
ncbi:MAG: hypothetical protein WC919_00210 [Candidatus Paceibacterota bacterium]|jgi:hypothetical protein